MKIKPGHTTTEFWLTLSAVLIQGGITAVGMLDVAWAATGITILTSLYGLLRFGLKANEQKTPPTPPA